MTPSRDEVAAAVEAVDRIDLTPINSKLRHENPSFWTDQLIAETETNYRRFLALKMLHPSTHLSVNKTLDEYWHQHILDTRKYAADCEEVFGQFLHHYPYFGMADEDEWQENLDTFAYTQQIWQEAFGVGLVDQTKLTLDKVIGGYQPDPDLTPKRIYAFPQACKSGQHCNKIVSPERFDPTPIVPQLPQEPFTPVRRASSATDD
jgi:hypothetical protein